MNCRTASCSCGVNDRTTSARLSVAILCLQPKYTATAGEPGSSNTQRGSPIDACNWLNPQGRFVEEIASPPWTTFELSWPETGSTRPNATYLLTIEYWQIQFLLSPLLLGRLTSREVSPTIQIWAQSHGIPTAQEARGTGGTGF